MTTEIKSSEARADVEKRTAEAEEDENQYPPKRIVIPALLAGYLAVFLVSLDRTIIGTAIPSISNEFQSFEDIAWYEAGFLLPLCVLQLSFGRILTFYSTKWVLIVLVAVFEIGSIVCATAPSSNAVIVGRVVSGIGAAGINAGLLVLINVLVPLSKRPAYTGGVGACFGIASVLGPLLGGYLTGITWRWVFWINLPIGGIALLALILVAPNTKPPVAVAETFFGKVKQLDPIGFILIAPATVCLLFALQFGGVRFPWNDGRIITLFVLAGILAIGFICSQIWLKGGTIPGGVLSQRSVVASVLQSFAIGSFLVVYSFYLPIWFQAIKGDSPQESGIHLIPLLLSTVFAVILSGGAVSVFGYYAPFAIAGGAIVTIGGGLISTFQVDTGIGKWIGYQLVVGIGQGLLLLQPNIATQTVLSKELAPSGLSLLVFVQFLSGSVFVTVCQTLLQNTLVSRLAPLGIDGAAISGSGATSLRSLVPASQLQDVLVAYNDGLRNIWYLTLALAGFAFLVAFGYEWKSVKKEEDKVKQANKESRDAAETEARNQQSEA